MVIRVPLPVQTMYAELVERAHLGQMASDFDPAGRFVRKTVNGRDYWYFRSAMTDGVRRDRYVGIDGPEVRDRIANHRSEKDGYKQRRSLVSALARTGLKGPDARTGRILDALARAGVFRLRGVVVGTAAYQTYSALLGIRLANSNSMTDDLDLAQFASISIAVEDAIDIPLLEILRSVDSGFRAVPDIFASGKSCRFALGDQYRVDVLTPNEGPDDESPVSLPALKSDAQPLRFLDFLIYQEVHAAVLFGAGIPINVPAPERYALHKLIVSRTRIATPESQTKARKDLRQAAELISALVDLRPYELKDMWDELSERGSRWRQLVSEAVSQLDYETGSRTVREKLEGVVGPTFRR